MTSTTITIDGKQYAIVPLDLSQEMLLAWTQYALDPEQTPDGRETWAAMLAAAPPVPLSAVLQAIRNTGDEPHGYVPSPRVDVCGLCLRRWIDAIHEPWNGYGLVPGPSLVLPGADS